jgi:hypothetical protein
VSFHRSTRGFLIETDVVIQSKRADARRGRVARRLALKAIESPTDDVNGRQPAPIRVRVMRAEHPTRRRR